MKIASNLAQPQSVATGLCLECAACFVRQQVLVGIARGAPVNDPGLFVDFDKAGAEERFALLSGEENIGHVAVKQTGQRQPPVIFVAGLYVRGQPFGDVQQQPVAVIALEMAASVFPSRPVPRRVFLIFEREYSTGVYLLSNGTETIGSMLVSLWGAGDIDVVAALSLVNVGIVLAGLALALRLGVTVRD